MTKVQASKLNGRALTPQEQVYEDIFSAALRVISRELIISEKQAKDLVVNELHRVR